MGGKKESLPNCSVLRGYQVKRWISFPEESLKQTQAQEHRDRDWNQQEGRTCGKPYEGFWVGRRVASPMLTIWNRRVVRRRTVWAYVYLVQRWWLISTWGNRNGMGECDGAAEVGGHRQLAVLESQATKSAFSVLDRMDSISIYLCRSMRKSMSKERSSSTELSQLCSGTTLDFCAWCQDPLPPQGRKGAGLTGLWVYSLHFNQTTLPSSCVWNGLV